MSNVSKRSLFWAPRALSIVFIAFLSLFAMDVFSEHLGLWRTVVALTMHLIPSFVLTAALILAWRWEWIGAVIYGAAGLLYVFWLLPRLPVPPAARPVVALLIAGPALLLSVLFFANWIKHNELRTR